MEGLGGEGNKSYISINGVCHSQAEWNLLCTKEEPIEAILMTQAYRIHSEVFLRNTRLYFRGL